MAGIGVIYPVTETPMQKHAWATWRVARDTDKRARGQVEGPRPWDAFLYRMRERGPPSF